MSKQDVGEEEAGVTLRLPRTRPATSSAHSVAEVEEDLRVKYEAVRKEHLNVLARLKETEEQLNTLKTYYGGIQTEYENLMKKCEIEAACRHHAEVFARKMSVKNRELKRKGQAILEQHGLAQSGAELGTDDVDVDEGTADDQDDLHFVYERMKELGDKNMVSYSSPQETQPHTESEKDPCSSQNENLRAELKQTKEMLLKYMKAFNRLTKASGAVSEDYESLRRSLEKRKLCQEAAEKYAAAMYAEREAARRQSSVLRQNLPPDEKFLKAMTEVKNLTIRVEEQKLQFERQISELQDEVRMLREQDVLGNLERENEQLQDLLEQTREEVKVAQDDYRTLAVQYKNLEKELAYATRPIILTPPLPPPPPPLDLVQFRGHDRKRKSDAKLRRKVKADSEFTRAVDEMMQRIKHGKPVDYDNQAYQQRLEKPPAIVALDHLMKELNLPKQPCADQRDIVDGCTLPSMHYLRPPSSHGRHNPHNSNGVGGQRTSSESGVSSGDFSSSRSSTSSSASTSGPWDVISQGTEGQLSQDQHRRIISGASAEERVSSGPNIPTSQSQNTGRAEEDVRGVAHQYVRATDELKRPRENTASFGQRAPLFNLDSREDSYDSGELIPVPNEYRQINSSISDSSSLLSGQSANSKHLLFSYEHSSATSSVESRESIMNKESGLSCSSASGPQDNRTACDSVESKSSSYNCPDPDEVSSNCQ